MQQEPAGLGLSCLDFRDRVESLSKGCACFWGGARYELDYGFQVFPSPTRRLKQF